MDTDCKMWTSQRGSGKYSSLDDLWNLWDSLWESSCCALVTSQLFSWSHHPATNLIPRSQDFLLPQTFTSFLLSFYCPRCGAVILRDIIIPFLYSLLHIDFSSIVQKTHLLPLWSSLSVISTFRKLNLGVTSVICPCPASCPSSVSVGYYFLTKAQQTPACSRLQICYLKSSQINFLFIFIPWLHAWASLPSLWGTAFPLHFQEQLNPSSPEMRHSAPGLSSTPTQHFLSLIHTPHPCFTQRAGEQRAVFGLCSQFLGGAVDELIGAALAPMSYGFPSFRHNSWDTLTFVGI